MKRLIFALGLSAGLLQTAFAAWYQLPSYGYVAHNRCCHFYTEFEAGIYRLNMPAFSYGEYIDPFPPGAGTAPLPEFAIKNDHVSAFYPRLALGVEVSKKWCPCWIRDILFELGIFYLVKDVNPGPGDGAFFNFTLPNINGSGDLLAVAAVAPAQTNFSGIELNRRYQYGGVQFKMGSDLNFYHFPQFAFTPFLEMDIDSVGQDYHIYIGSVVGVANATNIHVQEQLNTNYWDVGFGIDTRYAFSPCCNTFFIFAEASAFLSNANTRLRAKSSITNALGVTTMLRFFRKHNVVSGKARGQLGIGYQFGYNFMASIMGQIDYWGYVPRIINPHRVGTNLSGTGVYAHPATIVESTATNYAIIFSVDVTFF